MSFDKQKVKRPRTLTRIAAVQALFQWEQGTEKVANLLIEQFLLHRISPKFTDEIYKDGKAYIPHINLFKDIIQGFIHQSTKIDALLKESLPPEWPFHRLDPIIRATLRAATTEFLLHTQEPPKNVIINEYVDVIHAFSDGDESVLVNGILHTLGNQLRPATDLSSLENKSSADS